MSDPTAELIIEPWLYIDGRWVPGSGDDLDVENPATGEITGTVTQAAARDVEEAVAAARGAFPAWAATPVAERAAVLSRVSDLLKQRAEVFAGLVNREQGSPPKLALGLHVHTPIAVTDATIEALRRFPFVSELGNSLIRREPVGVVAAITPWNLPLHQVLVKVVPALAAGTTVVLKPAGLTPLSAFELARVFEAAGLPAGVFNLRQTCTALSRLIVPEARLGQVEQLAAEAAAKYIPGSRLGPLISAEQRKEVESFLESAAGGEDAVVVSTPLDLPQRGYWVSPTVVSRVDPDSRLAQEEVFGPVLSILAADSDDEAVEIANNSSYGLGGAVWGSDEAALAVAGRIQAGQVDVNGAAFNPGAPFGGYKQSGIGREMGEYGIADVCEIKAVQR